MSKVLLARIIFWLTFLTTLVFSLLPGSGVEGILGLDKVMHFAAFFVLAASLGVGYQPRNPYISMVLMLIIFGVAIEFIQQFIPNRVFSLYDFAADLAGVVLGMAFYRILGESFV